jgi:tetratricopeptide (TPR) repeat protein
MFATVISSFLLVPVLWLAPVSANAQTLSAPNSDSSAGQDLIARAREAEQKRDFQPAAALYQQYLKDHPDDAPILQRLGLVESLSSNWNAAIPPLLKALQLDHSLWGSALYLGISYYRTARFKDAVTVLKRSLELKPGVPETEFWLGCSLVAQNEPEAAVSHLLQAERDSAWDLPAQAMLVKAYQKAAEENYRRITAVAADSARVHLVQSRLLQWKGVNNGAVQEAREALQRDPSLEGAHRIMGEVFWREKAFDSAEREFESELQINPLDGISNLRLGEFWLAKSDVQQAGPFLRAALQQRAGAPGEADHFLGEAALAERDYSTAATDFERAAKENPSDPANHRLLAEVYRATGQPDLAAREEHLAHAADGTVSAPNQ